MFGIDDLITYTGIAGGLAVFGQIAAMFARSATHEEGELASGEFGSIADLKGLTGKDGLRLSKEFQLNRAKTYEHTLVVGATGEHKTTSLFYPNLLSPDMKDYSIVVTDPKGELYRDTAAYQKSIGREPILFNPLNPLISSKYNLLSECKNTGEVIELAQTILLNSAKALELQTGVKAGGIEWQQMSIPLFASSLLYVKAKTSPVNTITNAARLIINHSIEELEALFLSSGEEVKEQFNIFKSSLESPKTAASIKVTLNSSLQLFLDNNISQTTNKTEFNAKTLRGKPTCLYISYPAHKSNYLSPYMATFFTQLINQLVETQGIPVIFMCDEFANIGMINGFSNIISTCRSAEIGFLICLQSTSQLIQTYGRDNAKAILNNLKTKAVLPSISDIETLNYISDLLGDTQITIKNTSISDNKTTTSYSTTRKRLLDCDEIRRLKNDEILIIPHNRKPIKGKQNLYYLNPEYKSYIKKSIV